jgi:hypothetical protein
LVVFVEVEVLARRGKAADQGKMDFLEEIVSLDLRPERDSIHLLHSQEHPADRVADCIAIMLMVEQVTLCQAMRTSSQTDRLFRGLLDLDLVAHR